MLIKRKRIDATNGPILPLIVSFVIPLILTTLVQQLFNAVDIAVLGNMANETAVASVGATTTIIHLMIDAFVGISSGAKIVLSRLIGGRDETALKRTVDTALIVSVVFGVFVAIAGVIFAPKFLELVKCPAECLDGAVIYIRIYISAAPAILLYNYGAAIITSSGDSRRPFYYAVCSGLLNVALNVILCLILSEKVAAVAIATAASQILAAALVILRLRRFDERLKVRLATLKFNLHAFTQLMRFGIPIALQVLIFPLANLQIASAINSYGVVCVAGNSAASTMHNLTSSVRNAFGTAAATFIGQNLGAEKHERVRASLFHCTWLCLAVCLPIAFLEWLSGPLWLKLFLGSEAAASIEFAMTRVGILDSVAFFLVMNTVLGNTIQAFGYPIFSTLNGVIWTLGFRILWMAVIYPKFTSYASLITCFAISWVLTFLCNLVIFSVIYMRYRKGKYKRI